MTETTLDVAEMNVTIQYETGETVTLSGEAVDALFDGSTTLTEFTQPCASCNRLMPIETSYDENALCKDCRNA